MTFTDFDNTLFETGDAITQTNIQTYIGNNIMALYHPLSINTADRDVTNTTSQLSLWSTTAGGVTIPANAMGINGSVVMYLEGDILANNQATDDLTLRLNFGGATQITIAPADVITAISATRRGWTIMARVSNRGATNSQVVSMVWQCPATAAAASNHSMMIGWPPPVTAAVDTTASQTIDVTAQWGATSTNDSIRKRWAQTLLARN